MLIQVTQEDINGGVCRHAYFCAIAMAVRRRLMNEFPSVKNVTVDGICIRCYDKSLRSFFSWRLPHHLVRFLVDFDSGMRPAPIEFDLPIDEALKMQAKDGPTITPTELETIAIKLTPTKAEELCETTSPTSL